MSKSFSKALQVINVKSFMLTRCFVLLYLSLFGCSLLFSQSTRPQVQQYKILGISVDGNKSAETPAIIANSGLKLGDEITVPGEQTRTAITRLWALRIFSDVEIDIENTIGDGVYLLIKVKEHPRLDKTVITGNDDLSEDDLLKKVNLLKGQILTPEEISRIIRTIKKAYEDDGYLQASIKADIVESTDSLARGKVILKLTIDEGSEVHIGAIQFYGNKSFDADDLKGEMDDTHEKVWWKFWRGTKFDKKKYADDKKKVIDFYHKNGYRDAEILTDSTSYNEKKDRMIIRLFVYEGPQYKIRNITWDGNTVFKTEILDERLGVKTGDVYNMEKFDRNLKQNEEQTDVASLYLDNGYLTMSIDPEEVKVAPDSMDIIIHIRERNQFRVGTVEIRGNTKTKEKVIRRELYSRPGDFFSRAAIMRSVRQLSVLNYFNPDKIKPDTRIVDDKTVDVIYDVEEKSSDTFNMSVGYSGAFGFTGALGLTFNNFELAEPLSGGGGQILSFDWQFGEGSTYQTFSISFREPWLFGSRTSFGFSLFDTRQNYIYDVDQRGGTVSIGRQFKFPDDYSRGDWIFRVQRIDNLSASDYYGPPGVIDQYSITQILTRNSIDNPLFPSHGSNISLSTELSGPHLLPGTARYTKHIISLDWYTPILNNPKLALYIGTQYGEIVTLQRTLAANEVPYIEYFSMGGTGLGQINVTPLRGYGDRGIGPLNSSDQVLSGLVMEKHTAELRYNISMNPIPIYVLSFAEAGNVWNDVQSTELFDLNRSAGLGARIMINPIGLLGFDYGYGFDDPTKTGSPSGWHFHFQFGKGF